jgi:hypothetical protein
MFNQQEKALLCELLNDLIRNKTDDLYYLVDDEAKDVLNIEIDEIEKLLDKIK